MKRLLDIFVSLVVLTIALPLLLVVAALVRLRLGTPVVFRQLRPGLGARPFYLFKFRTMTDARGADGSLLPDSVRLTSLGRFLRSTSIDELPTLVNVLKGDMSLVGPRPLLMSYLQRYTSEQARRHEVKPGITGWAQVNGRNSLAWEQKFILDVWYVDHRSFWLDVKILVLTVLKVVKREGINAVGDATMPEFHGTQLRVHTRSSFIGTD